MKLRIGTQVMRVKSLLIDERSRLQQLLDHSYGISPSSILRSYRSSS